MNKKIITFLLVLIAVMSFSGGAFADDDVIGLASTKAANVFKAVRGIIFIVGGFGLVALAFFAIFGKLKWTWFASLAVGLAILAAAGAIIDYATTSSGEKVQGGLSGYVDDTLIDGSR